MTRSNELSECVCIARQTAKRNLTKQRKNIMKITKKLLKLALQWFSENDIVAYEIDGNIYVSTGEYDVQIADLDIRLRAHLQTSK